MHANSEILLTRYLYSFVARWASGIAFLTIISILSSIAGIRLGFVVRSFTWTLARIMEWATAHTTVHAEDEDNLPSTKESTRHRINQTIHHDMIKRDGCDALKEKLRTRHTSSSSNLGEARELQSNAAPVQSGSSTTQEEHTSFLALNVNDTFDFVKAGVESICQDDLNLVMSAQELPCFNLLSRSMVMYPNIAVRVQLLWAVGFVFRFMILVPVRVCLLLFGLLWLGTGAAVIVNCDVPAKSRRTYANWVMLVGFRILGKSCSLLATYHDRQTNRPRSPAICVANHTTPLDVLVCFAEDAYALTGQKHGAMLGYIQKFLNDLSPHLWFERSSQRDRSYVKHAIGRHLKVESNPPILIFPEGVCVNNTATVMFRKGAFEATDIVYPIAIRYDAKYADAFWWQWSWLPHIWDLMTSWALVVDVYYLPPMARRERQTASEFAEEVKAAISSKCGLRFLEWDGMLKLYAVKEERKELERREYSEHLVNACEQIERGRRGSESSAMNLSSASDSDSQLCVDTQTSTNERPPLLDLTNERSTEMTTPTDKTPRAVWMAGPVEEEEDGIEPVTVGVEVR